MKTAKNVFASLLCFTTVFTGMAGSANASGGDFAVPASEAWGNNGTDNAFINTLESKFNNPETEYRPEVRWWLEAGFHTNQTLENAVAELAESGFGGAELLARGNPSPVEEYSWGSEEWSSDQQLLIKELAEKGMHFSLTSGTNWGNANLPDTYTWGGAQYNLDNKAASKELDYATISLDPSAEFNGELPKPVMTSKSSSAQEFVLEGVIAAKVAAARSGAGVDYAEGSGTGVLDPDTIDLTEQVVAADGSYTLSWAAPDDSAYQIFVYWMHGTGETAEPSVSKNYTVNYVDTYGIEALKDYWEEFILTDEIKEIIRESGNGEIYMDSLELSNSGAGGVFWGYNFKEEFKNRRGYDITRYLPFITKSRSSYDYEVAEDSELYNTLQKIRKDVDQTYTELYQENVLGPLREWLQTLNMDLRAEPSYGQNFEISTPAEYLGDVETESLAFTTETDLYRGFSGGAHIYNRTFSSETGAINGGNYKFDLDYWTQMAYLQFASGIQRTVFHGYSTVEGPDTINWPGYEGMNDDISERFSRRQPAQQYYYDWTTMLARNQKVLRQGTSRVDIGILRTDYAYPQYMKIFTADDLMEKNNLMNDSGVFWKDLGMQSNGYTYDYFAPMILEDEENVSYADGLLQPDGPGYQALIIYQDAMPKSSADKVLEMAREGMPVLFVNGVTETVAANKDVTNEQAASVSLFNDSTDEQLQAVVDEIKALPNVRTIDNQSATVSALQELGVYPRVEFQEPNKNILTVTRQDEESNALYTYAYNYKFDQATEPFTFEMAIDAPGKPYFINSWTGDVGEIGTYEIREGRTYVTLTLNPGESTIVALDLSAPAGGLHAVSTTADKAAVSNGRVAILATESGSYQTTLSDGSTIDSDVAVPDSIPLKTWNLVVEDWNEGDKQTIEETQFGHTTVETYIATKKTSLEFPNTTLMPWKDLPATAEQLALLTNQKGESSMSNVSGVGYYETNFEIPDTWTASNGAYLRIGSTNGSIAYVYVNGAKAQAVDARTLTVDITDLLVKGTNTIRVEVPSTLTNRMLARASWTAYNAGFTNPFGTPEVQSYGMTGDVAIVPYTVDTVDISTEAAPFTVTARFTVGNTENATELAPNQMLDAGVNVANNTNDSQDVLLIVALYDPNGTMVNVSYVAATMSGNSNENLHAGFKLPSNVAGYYVRALVWDGTSILSSPMNPLSGYSQIP